MKNPQPARRRLLASYEQLPPPGRREGERRFRRILAGCLIGALGLGSYLLAVDVPPEVVNLGREIHKATFVLVRDSVRLKPEPDPEPEDLTRSPVLAQEEARPAEDAAADQKTDSAPQEPEPEEEAPRRVYGLRKVFARGLGDGPGGAGSIISKRGNTLDKEPDSLVATEADLAGPLAPLSTVTEAPVIIHRVKPEYTPEMIEHAVEGTVSARLLIDVDGTVKAVDVIEDLGFGSRQAATRAFQKLRFKPALRDGVQVAVWIMMKYRFVLQG